MKKVYVVEILTQEGQNREGGFHYERMGIDSFTLHSTKELAIKKLKDISTNLSKTLELSLYAGNCENIFDDEEREEAIKGFTINPGGSISGEVYYARVSGEVGSLCLSPNYEDMDTWIHILSKEEIDEIYKRKDIDPR